MTVTAGQVVHTANKPLLVGRIEFRQSVLGLPPHHCLVIADTVRPPLGKRGTFPVSTSQGPCRCQDTCPNSNRQITRSLHLHRNPLHRLKLDLKAAQVEPCGFQQRIHEQAKIVSVPCSTDPKTRGLRVWCRCTASRMAVMWVCRASDGLIGGVASPCECVSARCSSYPDRPKSSRKRSIWCMRSCRTVTMPMSPLPSRFQ